MKKRKIRSLSFWRRNPNSVESVYYLSIKPTKEGYLLTGEKDGKKERLLSNNEIDALLSLLFNDYKIDEIDEQYKAFKYEDEVNNFTLKFFLTIDFSDYTYLCIKGIHPFKQPHYQEILKTFDSLLD